MGRPPPALQIRALDLDHRPRVARHFHEAAVLRHGAHHVHVPDLVLFAAASRISFLVLLLLMVASQELLLILYASNVHSTELAFNTKDGFM